MSLLEELKRRNVIRVATAYVVVAWLVIQVVETIFPAFGFSDKAVRVVVIVFAIGFVPAVIAAWVFELTPRGLKRDSEIDSSSRPTGVSARWLDRTIIVVLLLGISFFALDKFVLAPDRALLREAEIAQQARSDAVIGFYGDRSIAVLPFANMSSDPEQEYFGDGIAEEILNILSNIRELRVISRSSAFTFKGRGLEVPEIARQLDVAHILEGSVRKSGSKIRVTAQLIEARTDTHLWSATYDRELADVFLIQDEIAADVVKNLHIKLLSPLPKSRPTDPDVLALTQQAKQIESMRLPQVGRKMQQLLDQALEIDPNYVPALEWMISAAFFQEQEGDISRDEQIAWDRQLKQRILELDPDNALVYAANAFDALFWDGDIDRPAVLFSKALSERPNDANIARVAGWYARFIGRMDIATRLGELSTAVDPLCYPCLQQLSRTYFMNGQFDKAERTRARYLAVAPGGYFHYALMKLFQNDTVAALNIAKDISEGNEHFHSVHAMIGFTMGENSEAEAHLQSLQAMEELGGEMLVAQVSAWMNRTELAFERLAAEAEFDTLNAKRNVFLPTFQNLHADPRWDAWRESIGMSEARLAAIPFNPQLPD